MWDHPAITVALVGLAADVVVAHNGDRFDLKKINARFVINGLARYDYQRP
jgi:hypothetical protein